MRVDSYEHEPETNIPPKTNNTITAAGKGHIDEASAPANVLLHLQSHDDTHKGGDQEPLSSTSRQAERFFFFASFFFVFSFRSREREREREERERDRERERERDCV